MPAGSPPRNRTGASPRLVCRSPRKQAKRRRDTAAGPGRFLRRIITSGRKQKNRRHRCRTLVVGRSVAEEGPRAAWPARSRGYSRQAPRRAAEAAQAVRRSVVAATAASASVRIRISVRRPRRPARRGPPRPKVGDPALCCDRRPTGPPSALRSVKSVPPRLWPSRLRPPQPDRRAANGRPALLRFRFAPSPPRRPIACATGFGETRKLSAHRCDHRSPRGDLRPFRQPRPEPSAGDPPRVRSDDHKLSRRPSRAKRDRR